MHDLVEASDSKSESTAGQKSSSSSPIPHRQAAPLALNSLLLATSLSSPYWPILLDKTLHTKPSH
jgi:hypothetical protein